MNSPGINPFRTTLKIRGQVPGRKYGRFISTTAVPWFSRPLFQTYSSAFVAAAGLGRRFVGRGVGGARVAAQGGVPVPTVRPLVLRRKVSEARIHSLRLVSVVSSVRTVVGTVSEKPGGGMLIDKKKIATDARLLHTACSRYRIENPHAKKIQRDKSHYFDTITLVPQGSGALQCMCNFYK